MSKIESDKVTLILTRGGGSVGFPIPFERIRDESLFLLVEELHGPRGKDYLVPLTILFIYRGELPLAEEHVRLTRDAGFTDEAKKWSKKLEWVRKQAPE